MSVAAFFDLDGTLLPLPSLERRFLRFLAWRGELGAFNAAHWFARFVMRAPLDFLSATDGNKAHLAGVPVSSVAAWAAFLDRYPIHLFPAAFDRIAWHHRQGHHIFIISGTLEPLAQIVLSRALPFHFTLCATRLESRGAHWTGRTLGEPVCGPGKLRAIRTIARSRELDLSRCFAYGDSLADHWMLAGVGHPVVVNPSLPLRQLARLRGWPIVHWSSAASTTDSNLTIGAHLRVRP